MDRRSKPKTEADVLRTFADLFDQVLEDDIEELDAALRAYGYDPDAIGEKMQTIAEQALAESPMNWRNRARLALQQGRERLASLTGQLGQTRAQLQQKVTELREQARHVFGEEAVAHFRNFEELTDEDLADIAEELLYLLSDQDQRGNGSEFGTSGTSR